MEVSRMNNYTREDILRMVEEEDVGFIRLQFTDIFGTMKNIAITTSQLDKALNNEIMFDGSAIEGFARVEESDMYLYPNLNTFEIFPWRPQQGKVARLICDVYKPDGTPYESDPRYILKKVMEDAKEMGYEFNVGPELEFFLFHTDDDGLPTTLSHESAGYFDLGPLDLGDLDVVVCLRCVVHTSVYEVRTFEVYVLRVRLDDVGSDVASDFEHTLIVLDSVLEVDGRILIFIFVGEVALLELYYALHFRVIKIEIVLRMVSIKVSHCFYFLGVKELRSQKLSHMQTFL